MRFNSNYLLLVSQILILFIWGGCYINDGESAQAGKVNPYNENYVKDVFRDDFNDSAIDESVWQIATWPEQGGQTSKDRCYVENGCLTLKFIYNPNASPYTYLCSAIQTRKEFLFGKWEARVKTSSVPGVLNSIFTIDWDNTSTKDSGSDGTKQEIDIEFLTFAQEKVHFAVHAPGRKSFDTNPDVDLTFKHSSGFHTVAINITPEYIEWSMDGVVLKKYKYSDGEISITAPYQLKLNNWSSVKWINGPPAPNTECIYQIDWIQFTPYTGK